MLKLIITEYSERRINDAGRPHSKRIVRQLLLALKQSRRNVDLPTPGKLLVKLHMAVYTFL